MSKAPPTSSAALSRMLAERSALRASGILRAERGKMRRLFCLENGLLIYALSNVVEEQIDAHLVRAGLLTPHQKAAAVTEVVRSGRKLSEAIVGLGFLQAAVVRESLEQLFASLLSSTLEWPEGTFEFDSGRPSLDGEVTVALSPFALIVEHARRFPLPIDLVRTRIGPPDARPAAVPERRAMIEAVLDDQTLFLLDRCDGSLTVPEIVTSSSAGEEPTLRALHGLILVGAVSVERGGVATGARPSKAPPIQREECLAILQRASATDHYSLLGLTRTAPTEEIRRAYYALARRYHPDRFRAGALHDLLPRFEHFFAMVTEAYNTLSSEELRAQYDEQLQVSAEPESAKLSETAHLARENYNRGRALAERRRFADALTFLENAVQLDASQAAYHLELGLLLARNPRRRAEAEKSLIRTIEIEPARTAAYLALGELYQRAGKLGHAARMYREALRWDPEHLEASRLLHEVGDIEGEGEFLRPVFES